MPPYKKTNRVTDIEHPIASNIHGRDILGINANIPAISKTNIDLQNDKSAMDYTDKIK